MTRPELFGLGRPEIKTNINKLFILNYANPDYSEIKDYSGFLALELSSYFSRPTNVLPHSNF